MSPQCPNKLQVFKLKAIKLSRNHQTSHNLMIYPTKIYFKKLSATLNDSNRSILDLTTSSGSTRRWIKRVTTRVHKFLAPWPILLINLWNLAVKAHQGLLEAWDQSLITLKSPKQSKTNKRSCKWPRRAFRSNETTSRTLKGSWPTSLPR